MFLSDLPIFLFAAFIQSDTILEVLHFGEGNLLQVRPLKWYCNGPSQSKKRLNYQINPLVFDIVINSYCMFVLCLQGESDIDFSLYHQQRYEKSSLFYTSMNSIKCCSCIFKLCASTLTCLDNKQTQSVLC